MNSRKKTTLNFLEAAIYGGQPPFSHIYYQRKNLEAAYREMC